MHYNDDDDNNDDDDGDDDDDAGCLWKVQVHDADACHSDSRSKMVSEIYLTRLLAMKVQLCILTQS